MSKLKRIAALFTLSTFFIQQFIPASLAQTLSFQSEMRLPNAFELRVSPEAGTVASLAAGTGPVLVHIQTAHGNYEAQKKIQALLHELKDNYGIDHIFVEGSAFPLDPEALRLLPDDRINRAVADELTKKALFKGVDLFLLDEPGVRADGIEDPAVYEKNVEALREVLAEREKTGKFLADLDFQIDRLTGPYLNKDLRSFLKRLEEFETERLTMQDWLPYLKEQASKYLRADLGSAAYQLDWPALVRVFKLQELEKKFDAAAYAKENRVFLAAVKKRLPEEKYEAIEKLLTPPLSRNQLPYPATGLLFEDLIAALPADFDYAAFPNVRAFIGHLILQSEVSGALLGREMEDVTERITSRLAKTPEEKQIVGLLASHRLLKRLFALQLTPSDYEKISAGNVPSALTGKFLEVNKSGRVRDAKFGHMAEIDALYARALEFYSLVKERDGILCRNVLAKMKEQKIQKAVVVTGGFHADPFRSFFESEHFNYALITPAMTTRGGYEAYVDAFLAGFRKSTLEFGEAALPADQRLGWTPENVVTVVSVAAQTLARAGRLENIALLNESAFTRTSQGVPAFRVSTGTPAALDNVRVDFEPSARSEKRGKSAEETNPSGIRVLVLDYADKSVWPDEKAEQFLAPFRLSLDRLRTMRPSIPGINMIRFAVGGGRTEFMFQHAADIQTYTLFFVRYSSVGNENTAVLEDYSFSHMADYYKEVRKEKFEGAALDAARAERIRFFNDVLIPWLKQNGYKKLRLDRRIADLDNLLAGRNVTETKTGPIEYREIDLAARSEIRPEADLHKAFAEKQAVLEDWNNRYGWDATVLANVRAWFGNAAVNEAQRKALLRIIEEGKADRIPAGFSSEKGVLQPGTAGTRGEMENLAEDKIGPNYFSETTVIQYTWSFVNWYKSTPQKGPVFITKEVRANSDLYGDLSARILLANGIPVIRVAKAVSTPFASFLAKWLGRGNVADEKPAFGYQISASHNKLDDNGIKFMGPEGQQLMPELMSKITAGIPSLGDVRGVPEVELKGHPLYHELTSDEFIRAEKAYFAEIDSTMPPGFKQVIDQLFSHGKVRFVFTPLNGASGDETVDYLEHINVNGLDYVVVPQEMLPPEKLPPDVLEVKRKQSADPSNDKVLERTRAIADELGVDMVLARDPDGDRFVISMKVGGEWKKLDGNQNAIVMLHDRLSSSGDLDAAKMLVMRSHATTPLLDRIAASFGVKTIVVPVGFKYFGALVIRLFNSTVGRYFFGAEESYGTSNGHINEKDGLSGLINMLLVIARQRINYNRNVFEYLDSIYREYGYPADEIVNIPLPGSSKPEQDAARRNVLAALRQMKPGESFGAFEIVSSNDKVTVEGLGEFHDGYDLVLKDQKGTTFRLLFRPSGTEPIFKAYFSWQEPVHPKDAADLERIKADSASYVKETVRPKLIEAFAGMAAASAPAARSEKRISDRDAVYNATLRIRLNESSLDTEIEFVNYEHAVRTAEDLGRRSIPYGISYRVRSETLADKKDDLGRAIITGFVKHVTLIVTPEESGRSEVRGRSAGVNARRETRNPETVVAELVRRLEESEGAPDVELRFIGIPEAVAEARGMRSQYASYRIYASIERAGIEETAKGRKSVKNVRFVVLAPLPAGAAEQGTPVRSEIRGPIDPETAALDEAGYQAVAAAGNVQAMMTYIRRVLESLGLELNPDAVWGGEKDLEGFAAWFTAKAEGVSTPKPGEGVQTLEAMTTQLQAAPWVREKGSVPVPSAPAPEQAMETARTAALDEEGYQSVARLGDVRAMEVYIERIADHLGLQLARPRGEWALHGFAPWFTAAVEGVANPEKGKGAQSFAQIVTELAEKAQQGEWIRSQADIIARRNAIGFDAAAPVDAAVFGGETVEIASDVTDTLVIESRGDDQRLVKEMILNNKAYSARVNQAAEQFVGALIDQTLFTDYKAAVKEGRIEDAERLWAKFLWLVSGGYTVDISVQGKPVRYQVPALGAEGWKTIVKDHILSKAFFLGLKEYREKKGIPANAKINLVLVTRSVEEWMQAFLAREDVLPTLAKFGIANVHVVGVKVAPSKAEPGPDDFTYEHSPVYKDGVYAVKSQLYIGDNKEAEAGFAAYPEFINVQALAVERKAEAEAYFDSVVSGAPAQGDLRSESRSIRVDIRDKDTDAVRGIYDIYSKFSGRKPAIRAVSIEPGARRMNVFFETDMFYWNGRTPYFEVDASTQTVKLMEPQLGDFPYEREYRPVSEADFAPFLALLEQAAKENKRNARAIRKFRDLLKETFLKKIAALQMFEWPMADMKAGFDRMEKETGEKIAPYYPGNPRVTAQRGRISLGYLNRDFAGTTVISYPNESRGISIQESWHSSGFTTSSTGGTTVIFNSDSISIFETRAGEVMGRESGSRPGEVKVLAAEALSAIRFEKGKFTFVVSPEAYVILHRLDISGIIFAPRSELRLEDWRIPTAPSRSIMDAERDLGAALPGTDAVALKDRLENELHSSLNEGTITRIAPAGPHVWIVKYGQAGSVNLAVINLKTGKLIDSLRFVDTSTHRKYWVYGPYLGVYLDGTESYDMKGARVPLFSLYRITGKRLIPVPLPSADLITGYINTLKFEAAADGLIHARFEFASGKPGNFTITPSVDEFDAIYDDRNLGISYGFSLPAGTDIPKDTRAMVMDVLNEFLSMHGYDPVELLKERGAEPWQIQSGGRNYTVSFTGFRDFGKAASMPEAVLNFTLFEGSKISAAFTIRDAKGLDVKGAIKFTVPKNGIRTNFAPRSEVRFAAAPLDIYGYANVYENQAPGVSFGFDAGNAPRPFPGNPDRIRDALNRYLAGAGYDPVVLWNGQSETPSRLKGPGAPEKPLRSILFGKDTYRITLEPAGEQPSLAGLPDLKTAVERGVLRPGDIVSLAFRIEDVSPQNGNGSLAAGLVEFIVPAAPLRSEVRGDRPERIYFKAHLMSTARTPDRIWAEVPLDPSIPGTITLLNRILAAAGLPAYDHAVGRVPSVFVEDRGMHREVIGLRTGRGTTVISFGGALGIDDYRKYLDDASAGPLAAVPGETSKFVTLPLTAIFSTEPAMVMEVYFPKNLHAVQTDLPQISLGEFEQVYDDPALGISFGFNALQLPPAFYYPADAIAGALNGYLSRAGYDPVALWSLHEGTLLRRDVPGALQNPAHNISIMTDEYQITLEMMPPYHSIKGLENLQAAVEARALRPGEKVRFRFRILDKGFGPLTQGSFVTGMFEFKVPPAAAAPRSETRPGAAQPGVPPVDRKEIGVAMNYTQRVLPRPLAERLAGYIDAGPDHELTARFAAVNDGLAKAGFDASLVSIRVTPSLDGSNQVRELARRTLGRDLPDNVRLVVTVKETEVPEAALLIAGFNEQHNGHLTLVMPVSAEEAKEKERAFEDRVIEKFHVGEGVRSTFDILPAGTKAGYDDAVTQMRHAMTVDSPDALLAVTAPEEGMLTNIPAAPRIRRFDAEKLDGNMSIGGSVSLIFQLTDQYQVIIHMSEALARLGQMEKIQAFIRGMMAIARAA